MLLLLALAGCWPHIPGHWSDYADTGAANGDTGDGTDTNTQSGEGRILGELEYDEYVGGYWSTPTDITLAMWGYLDSPEPDANPLELMLNGGSPGCIHEALDITGLLGGMRDNADESSTIHGPSGDIPMVPASDYPVFVNPDAIKKKDLTDGATYTMEGTVDGRDISVASFAKMPSMGSFDGPTLDGTDSATAGVGDFSWTWSGIDNQVIVILQAVDSTNAVIETEACLAKGSEQAIDVPTGDWKKTSKTVGWYVSIGQITESDVSITGDASGQSRVIGVHQMIGYLTKG